MKKTQFYISIFCFLFTINNIEAQVKIGNNPTTINAGSVLEIESTNKGLLFPRVSLGSTTAWGLTGTAVAGMSIYNTNAGITGNTAYPAGGRGFYVFDGTGWVFGGLGSVTAWSLRGNAGTTIAAGLNFVGTTDANPLEFRVNSLLAGHIGLASASDYGTSLGVESYVTTYCTALGAKANAYVTNGVAVGYNAQAAGGGTTVGYNSSAYGNNSTSVGYGAVSNNGSVSIGNGASANTTSGVAIGEATNASVLKSVAIGYKATAYGNYGIMIGSDAQGTVNGIAIGNAANAYGSNGVSIGTNTTANINSIAIGNGVTAFLSNTTIIGTSVTSSTCLNGANANTQALIVGTNTSNGNGAYLTPGGTWTNASDKDLKTDFTTLNAKDVLQKIVNLDITKWRYKNTDEYHIGPMAQDFYAAFKLGTDDKHISTIDPAGVILLAMQALEKENSNLNTKISEQQKMLNQLIEQVNELKKK